MHCIACDKNLNDFESTRKVIDNTGKVSYTDLCNACYKSSGLTHVASVIERQDLSHYDDIDDNTEVDYTELGDLCLDRVGD